MMWDPRGSAGRGAAVRGDGVGTADDVWRDGGDDGKEYLLRLDWAGVAGGKGCDRHERKEWGRVL